MVYSISINFYPNHKEYMIAYVEAVAGIGCIIGPLFASALYSIGGYSFIFYSFGGTFILLSFFIKIIFPKKIDEMNND